MADSYINYEWFLKQDLSKYTGKWLAIIDKKVVASNEKVYRLIEEVRKEYPSKRPFITKIKSKLSIL